MSKLFLDHFVWVSVFGFVALSSCIRIIESPPMNCTQKELNCTARISDCLDESWIREQRWTPSAPFGGVEVTGEVREDEHGDQVPVMLIKWRAAQDASIQYLKGTVVHVLKLSNSEKLCVQYEFQNKIKKQNNAYGAPWSFSLDRFVAEPGVKYKVSVYNLPRPSQQGDHYYKSRNFSMPECRDVRIKRTKLCQLRGSLWEPNIAFFTNGLEATVQLDTGDHSERYKVFLESCYESSICNTKSQEITKEGKQTINATFSLKDWKATSCQFNVVIQPYFVGCSNDCVRQKKVFNTCKGSPDPSDPPQKLYYLIPLLGLLGAGFVGCCVITWKRNKTTEPETGESEADNPSTAPLLDSRESSQKRKVLILYSLDHSLYRDVVLKFSAFLQAECGTDVLLDLLDTQRMGELGHLAWLAGRKQEIEEDSSNKILLLCSRGVRAKWQAMLGGAGVLLKQDVLSPMGDMFTPALNLLLPDFKLPASFGKYVVAYFEGVSGEQDVPEPFHIAVKYKLMKHFEEIYFRLCGEEKHEPGRVKRVPGISEDEYFHKPSGRALRHAIEALQVHQAAHPDWFQQECLQSEEEAFGGAVEEESIPGQLHETCMHQVMLQYEKMAPPCVLNEVLSSQPTAGVLALSPMLREVKHGVLSQAVLHHAGPEICQIFTSQPVLRDPRGSSCTQVLVCPSALEEGSRLRAELSVQTPALLERNEPSVLGEEGEELGSEEGGGHGEELGEVQLRSPSHLSPEMWHSLLALQQSHSALPGPSLLSEPDQRGHSDKRRSGESDQGYISRSSLGPDPRNDPQSDPMAEVRKLQQECFMDSLRSPGLAALALPAS